MKTLLIDIETSPNLAYTFDLRNAFIGIEAIVQPSRMLCFAAQWLEDDETMFFSEWQDGRGPMVGAAHELIDAADVLMHYNGKKFDEPKLNGEMYRLGLKPPSPYQRIDLWRAVSKRFEFPSSKLQWVLKESELPGKIDTGGMALWIAVLNGDPEARKLFEAYCRNDVAVMKPLYFKMQPWIPEHPNIAVYEGRDDICTTCGSSNLEKRGYQVLQTSRYQRYCCKDCGKWSRGTRRISGSMIREVAA